ncbi:MAG: alanine racemase [Peptostreptococcaceae bacterium]
MDGNREYPLLEIHLDKIEDNINYLVNLCKGKGINIAGVIKGVNAQSDITKLLLEGGCKYIASSRIEQLIQAKEENENIDTMLIRTAMKSEMKSVVKNIEISLNSELETIIGLNLECKNQNKKHKIILMMDLGDLREGIFDKEELIQTAVYIESNLDNIVLYGIGTNLSCYGSIKPSIENLNYLCEVAQEIEAVIGRKLDMISGGSTTSLPLVIDKELPSRINNLRIGEALIIGRDLIDYWKYDLKKMHKDTMILKAEIIEIKEKPSYPIGEMFLDAFGNKPTYTDKGIRKRAILAVGKQDFVNDRDLVTLDEGVEIVGSSSDHLIIDITDSPIDFKLGNIMSFGMFYSNALYLTQSKYVKQKYIKTEKVYV